jgi:hypothetical protein
MENTDPSSAGSETSDPAATAAAPSLEGLLKLLESVQTADVKLAAELAPLTRDFLAHFAPQDPAERMLAAQIIATFSRAMFLARHANGQKTPAWFSLYSREADRAMNLFRKQMQTLADNRRPRPPRRTTFTTIRTANIAGQQLITAAVPLPRTRRLPLFRRPRRRSARPLCDTTAA